jgi:organic radical activating enzyme
MKIIAIRPMRSRYVSITWQVNDFCNYKCSYCNPGNWRGDKKNEDNFERVQENLDKIFKHYEAQGYQAFKFFFSGGEPTNWQKLIPLIEWLKTRLDDPQIGINTNLSRPLKYWEKNAHLFHDIVASFHPEFAKHDRYTENAQYLQDKVNYLCCRMMMREEQFQEVIDFGNLLKTKLDNYNIEWVPLFDDISTVVGPWEYGEEWMKEFFKTHSFDSQQRRAKAHGSKWSMASKEVYEDGSEQAFNGNRLTAERQNFFKDWKCWVSEGIFIASDGRMSAASCGQGPRLGNIFGTVDLNLEPVICKKYHCTCGTDMLLSKEKNFE